MSWLSKVTVLVNVVLTLWTKTLASDDLVEGCKDSKSRFTPTIAAASFMNTGIARSSCFRLWPSRETFTPIYADINAAERWHGPRYSFLQYGLSQSSDDVIDHDATHSSPSHIGNNSTSIDAWTKTLNHQYSASPTRFDAVSDVMLRIGSTLNGSYVPEGFKLADRARFNKSYSLPRSTQPVQRTSDGDPTTPDAFTHTVVAARASAFHLLQSAEMGVRNYVQRAGMGYAETVVLILLCLVCALGFGVAAHSRSVAKANADAQSQGRPFAEKSANAAYGVPAAEVTRYSVGSHQRLSSGHGPSPRQTPQQSPRQSPRPSLQGSAVSARSPSPAAAQAYQQQTSVQRPVHLCAGLVVPHSKECLLAVPAQAGLPIATQVSTIDILELSGTPMIRAEITPPSSSSDQPTLILRSVHGAGMIAYCRIMSEPSGRRASYVYDKNDELFAQLNKMPAPAMRGSRVCYSLTSGRGGLQLIFAGNFAEHAVNVANESRKSVADTEPITASFDPSTPYYKLRVAERVDVGLILCALLSIDQLEAR